MTTRLLSCVGQRRVMPCLTQTTAGMPQLSRRSYCCSTALRTKYAVADHSEAYETAMGGRHGDQLSLALREGFGKDDPPFDPFIEEELAEAAAASTEEDDYDDDEVEDSDQDEEDLGAEKDLVRYNNDGSVRWKKSELAAFQAGAPAGGLFAIIQLPGTQHKVTVDDVIVHNKLRPVSTYSVGSVHTLNDVLLVGSSHKTLVGMPVVTGAEVDVMVEEITRDAKVIVFKKRRRKHSQRKKGHRREVTMLRVLDIRMPSQHADHTHVARKEGGAVES